MAQANQTVQQPQVAKMDSVVITPRIQGVRRLDPTKSHAFTFAGYDKWEIDGAETPYVLLQTDEGPKGFSLTSLYYAKVALAGKTVGEIISEYNNKLTPDVGLTGTLKVLKTGENQYEYTIEDVQAHELVAS